MEEDRLLFAVPKKGRLHERCLFLLKHINLKYYRKHRHDLAHCTTLPVTLVFLPASDIAKYVGLGRVDLGITGYDICEESNIEVVQEMELGFGCCRLCVQAPTASSVKSVQELVGKRIVTSFPRLTKTLFDQVAAEAGSDAKTQVTYVGGSVEVACSLGLADAIVDLVESGATMRAHQLEVVHTILNTQALLISNPKSTHKELISRIRGRLSGILTAERFVMMEFNIPESLLAKAKAVAPAQTAPTISSLDSDGWKSVKCQVPRDRMHPIMEELEALGARNIVVTKIENCRNGSTSPGGSPVTLCSSSSSSEERD